jgi:hypothetical protein
MPGLGLGKVAIGMGDSLLAFDELKIQAGRMYLFHKILDQAFTLLTPRCAYRSGGVRTRPSSHHVGRILIDSLNTAKGLVQYRVGVFDGHRTKILKSIRAHPYIASPRTKTAGLTEEIILHKKSYHSGGARQAENWSKTAAADCSAWTADVFRSRFARPQCF